MHYSSSTQEYWTIMTSGDEVEMMMKMTVNFYNSTWSY